MRCGERRARAQRAEYRPRPRARESLRRAAAHAPRARSASARRRRVWNLKQRASTGLSNARALGACSRGASSESLDIGGEARNEHLHAGDTKTRMREVDDNDLVETFEDRVRIAARQIVEHHRRIAGRCE